MNSLQIFCEILSSLGSVATVITLIYMIRNQKSAQKQIDSLVRMAETNEKRYEMERLMAGKELYPQIEVRVLNDITYGLKFQVKNSAYPVELYRLVMEDDRYHLDITIKTRADYRIIRRGETCNVVPGEFTGNSYFSADAFVRLFLITTYNEAYEIRFHTNKAREVIQSQPIVKPFLAEEHDRKNKGSMQIEEYKLSGGITGTVQTNFDEVRRKSESEI